MMRHSFVADSVTDKLVLELAVHDYKVILANRMAVAVVHETRRRYSLVDLVLQFAQLLSTIS